MVTLDRYAQRNENFVLVVRFVPGYQGQSPWLVSAFSIVLVLVLAELRSQEPEFSMGRFYRPRFFG